MDDGLMLQIEVVDRGADVVVAIGGELDFGSTRELLAVSEPLAADGRAVVLDLAGVSFCDSSGLSALVRLHGMAGDAGGSLTLARIQPQVLAPLSVTMLDKMLQISPEVPAPASAPPGP